MSSPKLKARVYIDGFNLYYGIRSRKWYRYLWLDLYKLAKRITPPDCDLQTVKYFTSMNEHPREKYVRQRTFITALEATSPIEVIYGFYNTRSYIFNDGPTPCKHHMPREKFTDIHIAMNMMADAYNGRCDQIILVTGDIDMLPIVKHIRLNHPRIRIRAAFPPNRPCADLKAHATDGFEISETLLRRSLLPNPVVAPNGMKIHKPGKWT